MSVLYMVATPIGNLEDITLRALRILKEVDVIACEDTRHTRRLLDRFEIAARVIACHAHNEEQSARGIVMLLAQGQSVAYVSDAGTPGISDPGARLVRRVREAGFQTVPIPGVSALTALASISGFSGGTLLFEGFLSPKSGRRRRRLQELLDRGEAFVLYESPFRLAKLLGDVASLEPSRNLLVGRELTKLHEELLEGTAAEVLDTIARRQAVKGECAVIVAPPKSARDVPAASREPEEDWQVMAGVGASDEEGFNGAVGSDGEPDTLGRPDEPAGQGRQDGQKRQELIRLSGPPPTSGRRPERSGNSGSRADRGSSPKSRTARRSGQPGK